MNTDLKRLNHYTIYNQQELEDEIKTVQKEYPTRHLLKFALLCLLGRKEEALKERDHLSVTAQVIRFMFYLGDVKLLNISDEIIKDINHIDMKIIHHFVKRNNKEMIKHCYNKGLKNWCLSESLIESIKNNNSKMFDLLLSLERLNNFKNKSIQKSLIDETTFYAVVTLIQDEVYLQKLLPEFSVYHKMIGLDMRKAIPHSNRVSNNLLFDFLLKFSQDDYDFHEHYYSFIIKWCIDYKAFYLLQNYIKLYDRYSVKYFIRLLSIFTVNMYFYKKQKNLKGILFRKFIDLFLLTPLDKAYLLSQSNFQKEAIRCLFQITDIQMNTIIPEKDKKEEKEETKDEKDKNEKKEETKDEVVRSFKSLSLKNISSELEKQPIVNLYLTEGESAVFTSLPRHLSVISKKKYGSDKPEKVQLSIKEMSWQDKLTSIFNKLQKRDWYLLPSLITHLLQSNMQLDSIEIKLLQEQLFEKFGPKVMKVFLKLGDDLMVPNDKYGTYWNKIRSHRKKNNTYKTLYALRIDYQKQISDEIYNTEFFPKVIGELISEYC
jgi:hypothetical protein